MSTWAVVRRCSSKLFCKYKLCKCYRTVHHHFLAFSSNFLSCDSCVFIFVFSFLTNWKTFIIILRNRYWELFRKAAVRQDITKTADFVLQSWSWFSVFFLENTTGGCFFGAITTVYCYHWNLTKLSSSIVLSLCFYFMFKSILSESKYTPYLPCIICQTQEPNILNKLVSIFDNNKS